MLTLALEPFENAYTYCLLLPYAEHQSDHGVKHIKIEKYGTFCRLCASVVHVLVVCVSRIYEH